MKLERRKDDWPLCPSCGEDELVCLAVPPLISGGWPMWQLKAWYFEHELFCNVCGRVTVPAGAAAMIAHRAGAGSGEGLG